MTDRERILEMQVKALADRLSIALSIMQDCEVAAGVDGDSENAEWWELQRRMLIGKDNDALQRARSDHRRLGFYRSSLTQVRVWMQRGLQAAVVRSGSKAA